MEILTLLFQLLFVYTFFLTLGCEISKDYSDHFIPLSIRTFVMFSMVMLLCKIESILIANNLYILVLILISISYYLLHYISTTKITQHQQESKEYFYG